MPEYLVSFSWSRKDRESSEVAGELCTAGSPLQWWGQAIGGTECVLATFTELDVVEGWISRVERVVGDKVDVRINHHTLLRFIGEQDNELRKIREELLKK